MLRNISAIIILVLISSYSFEIRAQETLEGLLMEIESNNLSLASRRKLVDAQIVADKVGNSLENPEVEYIHTWGSPAELGKTGELTIKQSFEFPTVYSNRNKLAKIRASQYGYEYQAFRQQLLLEAKLAYIEMAALNEQQRYLRLAKEDAERVAELFSKRVAAGDANILEENKARFELITASNAFQINEVELVAAMNKIVNLNGGISPKVGEIIYSDEILLPFHEAVTLYENASPEILSLIKGQDAARQDVRLSKSQSAPKLAVGYRHEFALGERFNGVVAGISIPMFGNKNNVKRAKAESLFAEAELDRTRVEIMTSLQQLYSKAELLASAIQEYEDILEHERSTELLQKALDAGNISVTEYFSQLQPIYDSYLTMIEAVKEYRMVCAMINMINL